VLKIAWPIAILIVAYIFTSPLHPSPKYRVSIKCFPDYKHLLQENYLEYKYIFLKLLKLVSKILCHVFIVMLQFQILQI